MPCVATGGPDPSATPAPRRVTRRSPAMMRTAPPPFGTPATQLRLGRILLALFLMAAVGAGVLGWLFYGRKGHQAAVTTEKSTSPGWTAAQLHYEKPEVKAEAPTAKPVDDTAAKLAAILAKLGTMQAELDELKKWKPTTTVVQQPPPPKTEPAKKAPASMLFVEHKVTDTPPKAPVTAYTLAPGAGRLPCIVETAINSDVEGYLTARVSTNVYDTATGRHLLVPQGSTILGHDQSQQLLYGNERLPTISLTLALPDGRSVDLGKAPITDQQGMAGLTGDVNNHWGRLFGAVFIGGALRGGMQALPIATAQTGGAGQVASGIAASGNQATTQRLGRALDTRPTIEVDAGQLCHVLLIKPLTLPAMWQ